MDRLIIWDSKSIIKESFGESTVVLSCDQHNANKSHQILLDDWIDKNKSFIRSEYLKNIYDFGTKNFGQAAIIDSLNYKNMHAWFLTEMAQKANILGSHEVYDVIKVIAYISVIEALKPRNLLVASNNPLIIDCIGLYSARNKISFKVHASSYLRSKSNKFLFLVALTRRTVALFLNLLHRARSKFLCRSNIQQATIDNFAEHVYVSYFENLSLDADKTTFKSGYWGGVPEYVANSKINSCWVHLPATGMPGADKDKKINILNKLNKTSIFQKHLFLDDYISIKIIFKSFLVYFLLLLRGIKTYSAAEYNDWHGYYCAPIMKKQFFSSLASGDLYDKLTMFFAFERFLDGQRNASKCFYLQENFSWESALIQAWRRTRQNGRIYGVVHTTVRFWDLRYHYDQRVYTDKKPQRQSLLPDGVIVNGPDAAKKMRASGMPKSMLFDAEALRYQHLSDIQSIVEDPSQKTKKILFVLSIKFEDAHRIVKMLERIVDLYPRDIFFVKPHYGLQIDLSEYDLLKKNHNVKILTEDLSTILPSVDIVLVDHKSSAIIDCLYYRKKIGVMRACDSLDFSPIDEVDGVALIKSHGDVLDFIDSKPNINNSFLKKPDFFYLDAQLPLWKSIIHG